MKPVLPLLMQLRPSYYHFNWQQSKEQVQIGMMAQETYKLFPELVSYNESNDVYKMNYAGFSTVAIKAIQEQQLVIETLQKQIDELNNLLKKLLEKK
ncbi:MAG: tail fiber domain-containing protein [Chitinophagaceae bacterium]|nr:tail fiber domain-containing protein [Chitinophagaceae bacterium]